MPTLATKVCEACGISFRHYASQGAGRFCGRPCYWRSMIGGEPGNKGDIVRTEKPCKNCGGAIVGIPSHVARRSFCSASCFGAYHSGPRHPLWQGGAVRPRHTSRLYREWRAAVLARDGGRCRWCDAEGERTYAGLEVHHIVPFAVAPEAVFDEANGIALCRGHHLQTRGRESDYAELLSDLIGEPLVAPPQDGRKRGVRLKASAEDLFRLYWDEGLSSSEIGRDFGVTGACVLKHMKRHRIPRRPGGRRCR